jgi:hypothetical protein
MLRYILQRIVLDTLYFPVWWYTRGFWNVIKWAGESLKDVERMAALRIWLKAMFKPMFQDYTREGRIVSFFMRVILLIFKLLMVGVWALILLSLVCLWLGLPVVLMILIVESFK